MVEINITDSGGKLPRKIGFVANQPSNENLLEINGFKLVISKIPETTYFCQTANLPGISIEALPQQTMFNPVLFPGGNVAHESFSVKFVVSESLNNWREIYNWIMSCSTYTDFSKIVDTDKSLVSDATLFILNSKNGLTHTVRFYNLFPKSLSSIEFDFTDTELTTLVSSVEFAFSHYEIVT